MYRLNSLALKKGIILVNNCYILFVYAAILYFITDTIPTTLKTYNLILLHFFYFNYDFTAIVYFLSSIQCLLLFLRALFKF